MHEFTATDELCTSQTTVQFMTTNSATSIHIYNSLSPNSATDSVAPSEVWSGLETSPAKMKLGLVLFSGVQPQHLASSEKNLHDFIMNDTRLAQTQTDTICHHHDSDAKYTQSTLEAFNQMAGREIGGNLPRCWAYNSSASGRMNRHFLNQTQTFPLGTETFTKRLE